MFNTTDIRKGATKFFKIVFWAITIFVVLSTILFGTFMFPPVQKNLKYNVEKYLQNTFQSNVTIGQLRYFPFKTLGVSNVTISDSDSIAIATIGQLKIDVGLPTLWRSGIVFTSIEADTLFVDMNKIKNLSIIQKQNQSDSAQTDNMVMQLDYLKIAHAHVVYNNYSVSNLNLVAQNLSIADSIKRFDNLSLSFIDDYNNKTPFTLVTSATLYSDTLHVPQINVRYGECESIIDNVILQLDTEKQFRASTHNTTIDLFTLRRYFPQLPPINQKFDLIGQVTLQNNKLDVHNLIIDNRQSTHAEVNCKIENIDNIHNSSVNISIDRLTTNVDDIASMLNVEVEPTVGQSFGLISGRINVDGRTNDKLQLKTFLASDAGLVDAQCNIDNLAEYKAKIVSEGLDLSRLTNNQIGNISFVIDLDGDTLFTHAHGNMPTLTLRNYAYHDVVIDGIVSNDYNTGLINIDDQNGQITIVAEHRKKKAEQHITLTTRIANWLTGQTNITPNINGKLNMAMRADFAGKDIDSSSGELLISNFSFSDSIRTANAKQMLLKIDSDAKNNKEISIVSDHINANVSGQFKYADVINEIYRQLYTHANALLDKRPQSKIGNVNLTMNLNYSDINQYLQFIESNLKISNDGSISGNINSTDNASMFQINIGDIESGQWRINDFNGIVQSNVENISVTLDVANVSMPTLGNVGALSLHDVLSYNIMDTDLEWDNMSAHKSGGTLSAITEFSKDGKHTKANIGFDESKMTLNGSEWTMRQSLLEIGHNYFEVKNFCFDKDEKFIKANGRSSEHITDTLTLSLSSITIEDILQPDPLERYSLGGDVSANMHLIQTYKDPIVNCNAFISRFHVDGDNLEQLKLNTQWSAEQRNMGVDVAIITGGKTRAHALGNIDSENNYMQLNFDIDSLSLGFLNFYLNKSVSNVRGTTSGKLQLHGPLNNIGLDARLVAHRTDFEVKSTLADYYFDNNDSVILSPTNMEFRHMRVRDKYGNIGYFGGNIAHNMFSQLKINIGFDVEKMLVMDMKPTDNPTYYGNIFADGRLDITGLTNNIDIRIKAETCPQTTFSVLPTAKSDRSENSYIRFLQPEKQEEQTEATPSIDVNDVNNWIKADIDVHINPSAKLNVILDQQTDNQLSTTGDGRLRLVVDRSGDLQLLGTYTIDDGIYNFSFGSIINKRFAINKGGTLTWDGDPFNPKIDIMATYKLKASLYDLVPNAADAQDLKKRVPINCNMFLTERMEDPNIRFKIEIPSTMNFNQYTLDQYISTEEEMNRQVFSLLLANRFYTSEEITGTQSNTSSSSYIGTTVSELVSNQLSNWISQNRYNIGVGVNYRPGDEVTQDEYEVALSTQMLDNKIILSGNIGYGRSTTETSDGSLIGDFDVEVKLNKSGNLRAKAYTHSNNDVIYETSPTTQGIGLSFREEFNSFRELLRKYWNAIRRKNKPTEPENDEAQ